MSAATDTSQTALTERQRRFVDAYADHGNGARAAREAGHSEKSAKEIACENLTKPHIQDAIKRRRKELVEEAGVRPDAVLRMIAAIATFDINEVLDDNGRVKEMAEMSPIARRVLQNVETFTVVAKDGTSYTTTSKVKIPDRLKALELLAKHFSLLQDNVKVGFDQENPFKAIIERAQGSTLQPIAQRGDGDTANEFEGEVIDGEVIEKEDTPAQPMASGSTLTDFSQLDDEEDEAEGDAPVAVAIEPKPEDSIVRDSDRDFAPLWKRRRRNV